MRKPRRCDILLYDVVIVLELGCLADGGDFHILDVLLLALPERTLGSAVLQLAFLLCGWWER